MTDNKTPDAGTKEHLKNVDDKLVDAQTQEGEDELSESEQAYEARNKAYAEGQEKEAARLKAIAEPYQPLSDLVDIHAAAEKGETLDTTPKKK